MTPGNPLYPNIYNAGTCATAPARPTETPWRQDILLGLSNGLYTDPAVAIAALMCLGMNFGEAREVLSKSSTGLNEQRAKLETELMQLRDAKRDLEREVAALQKEKQMAGPVDVTNLAQYLSSVIFNVKAEKRQEVFADALTNYIRIAPTGGIPKGPELNETVATATPEEEVTP